MEKIAIYLFLFVIFILMTIKNIGLIRRNAQAKKCNDFCQALLDEKENSYENLVNYINNQKDKMFTNKAKIFLLYHDLNSSKFENDVSNIDIKALFYKKGKFDKKLFIFNSDIFIWISLIMCKANRLGCNNVHNRIMLLFSELKNDLGDYLEYSVFLKGLEEVFTNKNDKLIRIIADNQENNYKLNPKYLDLYMIICEMVLISCKMTERTEIVDVHIKSFSNSKLGQLFLQQLKIQIE